MKKVKYIKKSPKSGKPVAFISDEIGQFDFNIIRNKSKNGWRQIPLFTK